MHTDFKRRWYNPVVSADADKQRALEAIQALPERATIADAIERLCFIAKIEEGLQQSQAGQVASHEEVKKRFLS
jgi:predicted transcriptional regulator